MEPTLRVLFLSSYFPKPGNPFMGTWALVQGQGLRSAGVDITVVSLTSWVPRFVGRLGKAKAWALCPPRHDWDGLPVQYPRWLFYQVGRLKALGYRHPLPMLGLGWLSVRGRLKRIVNEFQPDVIFAHHTGVNGYIAERLHRLYGIPYVVTDHAFEEITDCARMPGRKAMFERVVRHAHTMISVADRMRDDMLRLFPHAHAQTVHNGVELPPAALLSTPRPAELQDRQVVLSVGLMYERKAFPLLVKAFAQVAAGHPQAMLRIIGDGATRTETEAAIRETGMQERVQILGFKPRQQVLQEMAWCDCFALIGWDEPFATVFIEAMALGKPIITADDGGINDVVRDKVHGLVIPPHDVEAAARALDALLASPERCAAMGKAARQLVEQNLTWKANAHAMIDIFRQAAAHRRKESC